MYPRSVIVGLLEEHVHVVGQAFDVSRRVVDIEGLNDQRCLRGDAGQAHGIAVPRRIAPGEHPAAGNGAGHMRSVPHGVIPARLSLAQRVGDSDPAPEVGAERGHVADVQTGVGQGYDLPGAEESEAPYLLSIHGLPAASNVVEEAATWRWLYPAHLR